ncbi:MAG: diacylglycerol kinase family lipid kinase [Lachnospiraceae bacterium]|nr:diacylglycerol kinase family lipid kinase [Lachnospiraceae bacterium]
MLYFIINLKSRAGKGAGIIKRLEKTLTERGINYRIYLTRKAGDAAVFASKLSGGPKKRTVIVLGGDGTLNEFLNGLKHPENICLGYIPLGSGNDFARGMKISKNIEKEMGRILDAVDSAGAGASGATGVSGASSADGTLKVAHKKLDFGVLHCPDGTSKRFFVSCGVGYDAKVCVKVEQSRLKPLLNRIGLGKLIYLILGLRYLINAETYHATLTLDGEDVLSGDQFLFVSWQNQPYEGGGFYFSPKAVANDGFLDVCVAKGIPKWKIPFIIPLAKFGFHTRCKGVYQFRCKEAVIFSDQKNYVHTDGETRKNMQELHIEVVPAAIEFLQ